MWRILASILTMFGQATGCAVDMPVKRPVSVVIILSDDAGYADFGFTSDSFPGRTPSIDRLASEGVICTDAYVSASVCSPSRAGLLTGRHQQRFGHEFNLRAPHGLHPDERTIADHLPGHVAGAIGKWHVGEGPGFHPLDRGFESFFGVLSGSRSYFPIESPRRAKGLMRDRTLVEEPTYLTDTLTDEAVAFIGRHASEPFVLYVAYTAVHTPMHALEADLDDSIEPVGRRRLVAMTSALDRGVGRILDAIDEAGIRDETIVVFTNDNGGATNNHSDNGIYRGMKGSKWEGGIRVPFVIRAPGLAPGRYAHPVSTLDLVATARGANGMDVDPSLDGVDLLGAIASGEAAHRALFWRRGPAAAMREGRWKLVMVEGQDDLLFDLEMDPSETTDLAPTHPDRVRAMRASFEAWASEMVEPAWDTGEPWRTNQIRKHRMDVIGRDAERRLP